MLGTSEKTPRPKGWYMMAAFFLGLALSFCSQQAAAQESGDRGIVWTEHFDGSSSVDGKVFALTSKPLGSTSTNTLALMRESQSISFARPPRYRDQDRATAVVSMGRRTQRSRDMQCTHVPM